MNREPYFYGDPPPSHSHVRQVQGRHHYVLPPGHVGFGGGFTPKQLVETGVISFALAKILGASVPGAIVMGFGNLLWEAGSGDIAVGWKRYILGLFRKPE
jgi:hypothetical protein